MSETAAPAAPLHQPSAKEVRLVIAASSAGTVFEWYDFFIYGTLAAIIGRAFFPADNETLQLLLVWAESVYLSAVKQYKRLLLSYLAGVFVSIGLAWYFLASAWLPAEQAGRRHSSRGSTAGLVDSRPSRRGAPSSTNRSARSACSRCARCRCRSPAAAAAGSAIACCCW